MTAQWCQQTIFGALEVGHQSLGTSKGLGKGKKHTRKMAEPNSTDLAIQSKFVAVPTQFGRLFPGFPPPPSILIDLTAQDYSGILMIQLSSLTVWYLGNRPKMADP